MLVKIGKRLLALEHIVTAHYLTGKGVSTRVPVPDSVLELTFVNGEHVRLYDKEADALWSVLSDTDAHLLFAEITSE